MPTNLSTIPSTAIKVRWKEPYASEGLNRKFAGVFPPGVYRGLRLEESLIDLSVDLAEDSVVGDHLAVFESSEGFSTTYRDESSGRITLDLSSFASGETIVIALFVEYEVGTDTTAEIRGYTETEFDSAPFADESAEVVVIGTVLRPASGVIPQANITHDRRKIPFLNRAGESVPWNPLIRNGGFELGDTGETHAHASPFWTVSVSNNDFTAGPVDLDSNSGDKCFQIEALNTGSVSVLMSQDLYVPVIPGRQVRVSLHKRSLQVPSEPLGAVHFTFEDKDRLNDTEVTVSFDVSTVDAGFIEFDGVVFVPDNMTTLKRVQVEVAAIYGSTGACIRIDDVQAWLEAGPGDWLPVQESMSADVLTDQLFIGAQQTTTDSAKISFDGSNLSIERRDLDTAQQPGFSWPTAPAVNAAADAPRLSIVPSTTAGIEYTAIYESVPPGGKGYRKYVKPDGTFVETYNCFWNNASDQWTRDVASGFATKVETGPDGSKFFKRSAAALSGWTDTEDSSGWQTSSVNVQGDQIVQAVRDGVGNEFVTDPMGNPGRVHNYWRHDMSLQWNWDSSPLFVGSNVNLSGSIGGLFSGWKGRLFADAQTNSYAVARFEEVVGTFNNGGFTARVRWGLDNTEVMTNRIDGIYWGYIHTLTNLMLGVLRDTTVSNNLIIRYEDSLGADQDQDTGFEPSPGVWYFITLKILGRDPGGYLFRVGTTREWTESDTIVINTTLAEDGTLPARGNPNGLNWVLNFRTENLNNTETKELWCSSFELFSTADLDTSLGNGD